MSAKKSLDTLVHYLKTYRSDTELKPFFWLGAGCSVHDGVPLMDELLSKVLPDDPDDWGSPQFRFDQFCETVGQGAAREALLKPHLDRELKDDSPYKDLARLLKAEYADLVFTVNIDNLLEKALDDAGLRADEDYLVVKVPQMMPAAAVAQVKAPRGPRIRVVKLHGDLRWGFNYMTSAEIVAYDQSIGMLVSELTERAGVVCGYSFFHLNVLEAFSRARNPLFYANLRFPDAPMVLSLMRARNPKLDLFIDGDLGKFTTLMRELTAGLPLCQ